MATNYLSHERLLEAFESIFRGQIYKHRNQSLGNWVAAHLFEDLLCVAKSAKFVSRVKADTGVRHKDTKVVGGTGRRGDGTFGDLLPGGNAVAEEGFIVKRGPIGQVEIGAESKVLAKAMIKQIDRVIGDLNRQVSQFQTTGGKPICIALIGVNHADHYVGFEGKRKFPTDGTKHKHPIQEAQRSIERIGNSITGYDERLILPFRATNEKPYDFEWVNIERTRQEYSALLLRVSNAYESRF